MSNIITRDELKKLIDGQGDYLLIDVREKDELKYGMIPTAKNISMSEIISAFGMEPDEFEKKFKFPKFRKDDNIIFYCRTGGRSHLAAIMAISKGFVNSKNFKGSIWEWSEIDVNVKRYEH